jgi:catalase (peroxidase I)
MQNWKQYCRPQAVRNAPTRLQARARAPLSRVQGRWRMADAQEHYLRDFVAAWTKAMNLDRSDLR